MKKAVNYSFSHFISVTFLNAVHCRYLFWTFPLCQTRGNIIHVAIYIKFLMEDTTVFTVPLSRNYKDHIIIVWISRD